MIQAMRTMRNAIVGLESTLPLMVVMKDIFNSGVVDTDSLCSAFGGFADDESVAYSPFDRMYGVCLFFSHLLNVV